MKPGTLKSEAGIVAFIFTIFFLNMLSRLGLAPLLPAIEEELGLNHTAAGSLFLFVSVGYGSGLFSSPFISARINHRRMILLSAFVVGLSLLVLTFASGLGALRVSLLVLGFCGGLYLPSGVATLTTIVSKGSWGRVLAIHQLAPNLAYICSPLAAKVLLGSHSWRFVVGIYGIFSIIMGGLFWLRQGASATRGQIPNLDRIGKLITNPTIWMMILLFSLALGVNQGLFSLLPLYLAAEHQLASERANQLLFLSRLAAFAMPLAAGWVADTYGLKRMVYTTMAASGVATLLIATLPKGWLGMGLVLQAITSVCFFPLGFALLSRITSDANRSMAVAITVPFSHFIGAGISPALIGMAADAGHFSGGIALLGLLTLMGMLLLRRLSVPQA